MNRRSFLRGAGLLLTAPAIVRASSIMAIRPWPSCYPSHVITGSVPGMRTLADIEPELIGFVPVYGRFIVSGHFMARIEDVRSFNELMDG